LGASDLEKFARDYSKLINYLAVTEKLPDSIESYELLNDFIPTIKPE
jgi:hypothetical protein